MVSCFTCLGRGGERRGDSEEKEGVGESPEGNILFLVPPLNIA